MSDRRLVYYDPNADILWLPVRDQAVARSTEWNWGLVDLDNDGQTVGVEVWAASARFPTELLAMLPAPGAVTHENADALLRHLDGLGQ